VTPGQAALQEAVALRIAEMSAQHGRMYFLTDWIVVAAGQEMNTTDTTFVHVETRGPGSVSVHAELGLLDYARTVLKARIAARRHNT